MSRRTCVCLHTQSESSFFSLVRRAVRKEVLRRWELTGPSVSISSRAVAEHRGTAAVMGCGGLEDALGSFQLPWAAGIPKLAPTARQPALYCTAKQCIYVVISLILFHEPPHPQLHTHTHTHTRIHNCPISSQSTHSGQASFPKSHKLRLYLQWNFPWVKRSPICIHFVRVNFKSHFF